METFWQNCLESLQTIKQDLDVQPVLNFQALIPERTTVLAIDMVNGFANEGDMASPRVKALIKPVADFLAQAKAHGYTTLVFADRHTEASPEFLSYPPHCLADDWQSQVVDEIQAVGGYKLIYKNSTNGFLEVEFQKWLDDNGQMENFILVGDCTDICIQQFAITLKAFFNMLDLSCRVIVPIKLVDTFDLAPHHAGLNNLLALYNMKINGVEIVQEIV